MPGRAFQPQVRLMRVKVREFRAAALHCLVKAVENEKTPGYLLFLQPLLGGRVFGQVPVAVNVRGNQQGDGHAFFVELFKQPHSGLPGVVKNR